MDFSLFVYTLFVYSYNSLCAHDVRWLHSIASVDAFLSIDRQIERTVRRVAYTSPTCIRSHSLFIVTDSYGEQLACSMVDRHHHHRLTSPTGSLARSPACQSWSCTHGRHRTKILSSSSSLTRRSNSATNVTFTRPIDFR